MPGLPEPSIASATRPEHDRQAPPGGPGPARFRVLREVSAVFLAVTGLTAVLDQLRHQPGLREHVHLAVGLLFLVTALRLAQREPEGPARYGIDLAGLLTPPRTPPGNGWAALRDLVGALLSATPAGLRETGVALLVALVVFPPYALLFYVWNAPAQPFTFHLPSEVGSYFATQLLVVGLPEEALFRGYFQTRLRAAFPGRRHLLGVPLHPAAWLGQAALFALIHALVDLSPMRLAVFFPGLLFGWLRAWRGGIGAAIVLHALSNLCGDVLARGWL